CSGRRNHFVSLQRGLADHVYALPIVSISTIRVGSNHFIESGECIVNLASVGEHSTCIEVILRRRSWMGLSGQGVSFYGVVKLACLGISLRQIVVVSREVLGRVGIFVVGRALLDLDRFLISVNGRIQSLLLLSWIGLLRRGQTIGIAQLE